MSKSNKTWKTLTHMVSGLSAGTRIPCVCHTVELSVKKGSDIREISCVLKKASKLVAHFSRSTISSSKLKELQLQACLKRKKMIKMVLTRWRSHRDMSVSVVINRPALVAFFEENECLVEDEADPGKYLKMHLGTTDFKILDQFAGMLETMAQASQICEGDKYPTIGAALTALSMCISSMRPTTDITLCHPKQSSPTGCWSLACVPPELQSCGISRRGGSSRLMIMFEGFCVLGQCWTLASRRSKKQHPSSLTVCWIWTQYLSSNLWPGGFLRSRRLPLLLSKIHRHQPQRTAH